MRFAFSAAIAAVLLASTYAKCPNGCSGHGNCNNRDLCECWANWQGADCSLRTCLSGVAWAENHEGNAHYYAECSGNGLCDRASGECECFEGFSGRACHRSTCPNDCSGHGKCRLIKDLGRVGTYTDWDSEAIQACVCDGGYFGSDCSQRYCPKGDDPLTFCDNSTPTERQRIKFVIPATTNALAFANVVSGSDQVALTWTSDNYEQWTTQRIESVLSADASADIKAALENLPNFIVPTVSVTLENGINVAPLTSASYIVEFDSTRNRGNPDMLTMPHILSVGGRNISLGCNQAGCQPVHNQIFLSDIQDEAGGKAADMSVLSDSVIIPPQAPEDNKVNIAHVITYVHATGTLKVEVAYNVDTTTASGTWAGKSIVYAEQEVPSAAHLSRFELADGVVMDLSGVTFDADFTTDVFTTVPSIEITEIQQPSAHFENYECSGRGTCNRDTGMCACYEGYFGDNCGKQSVLV